MCFILLGTRLLVRSAARINGFNIFLPVSFKMEILHARRVCKKWLNWVNITDFTIGLVFGHELNEITEWFSKYQTSFGLNFAKASIHTIRTDQYAPLTALSNLTSLIIANKNQAVSDGKDPTFLATMTNLEQLDIHMVSTATITSLTNLKKLATGVFIIKDYYADEQILDEEIKLNLPFLESASFHAINAEDLPPLVSDGSRLTHLSLYRYKNIQQNYLDQFTNLKTLQINAQKIYYFTENYNYAYSMLFKLDRPLPSLESLTTNTDLTFFDTMLKLTYLEINPNTYSKNYTSMYFKDVELLTNLRVLKLREVDHDLDLSRLKQLSSLHLFKQLKHVFSFNTTLGSVSIDKLKELKLQNLDQDQSVSPISKFSNVINLDISFSTTGAAKDTADLSPIMTLTNLTRLVVLIGGGSPGSLNITINGISKLGNSLRTLSIFNRTGKISEGLEELKCLKHLNSLEVVSLANDLDIRGISALESLKINANNFNYNKEDLKYLTHLSLEMPLQNWSDLSHMTSLESFELRIVPLEQPEALLELTALKNLKTVFLPNSTWHDNLTKLSQLHTFKLCKLRIFNSHINTHY